MKTEMVKIWVNNPGKLKRDLVTGNTMQAESWDDKKSSSCPYKVLLTIEIPSRKAEITEEEFDEMTGYNQDTEDWRIKLFGDS